MRWLCFLLLILLAIVWTCGANFFKHAGGRSIGRCTGFIELLFLSLSSICNVCALERLYSCLTSCDYNFVTVSSASPSRISQHLEPTLRHWRLGFHFYLPLFLASQFLLHEISHSWLDDQHIIWVSIFENFSCVFAVTSRFLFCPECFTILKKLSNENFDHLVTKYGVFQHPFRFFW